MTNPNDNNDQSVVDDLAEFENAFYGKAAPVEKDPELAEEPKDEADEVEDDTGEIDTPASEDDDDESEDDSDEDAEDEESEDELEPEPKPKKKSNLQERINDLVAKAREAERREQDALVRLAALEAAKTEKKEEPKPELKRPDFTALEGAPNPDEKGEDGELLYPLGEFDPLFIRDLTRFTIQKETEAHRQAEQERSQQEALQQEQAALQTAWTSKLTEVEKEIPDLRTKIGELEATFTSIDPDLGKFLATTIMTCDNGPQILYYLSQNISEAQKIVASGPTAATLAIGRLEARLERIANPEEKSNNKKKVSTAPEPPKTATRGSGTKQGVKSDTDDLEAFEREFFNKKR